MAFTSSRMVPPYRFTEDVSGNEHHIRGTLGQSAHEIRVPLGAKGHIDPDTISVPDKRALQVPPHAVEHLKLESIDRDPLIRRKSLRLADQPFVVCRDAGIVSLTHQLPHAAIVVRI